MAKARIRSKIMNPSITPRLKSRGINKGHTKPPPLIRTTTGTVLRRECINRFLTELNKNIVVDKAILFGSTAKAKSRKWSDLDIAIISNDFIKLNPIERLVLLGKIAWQAHTTEIEALGYTPKEYKSADRFDFLYEIKKTGRIIYS